MNKKGIFVTFAAVLILTVIIYLMLIVGEEHEEVSEINIQYTKYTVFSDYIKNLEENYLPSLISLSSKQAMLEISLLKNGNPLLDMDIEKNLTQAIMGENDVLDENLTLPKLLNISFNTISDTSKFESFALNVTDVEQTDPWTITIFTNVSFCVKSKSNLGINESRLSWCNSQEYTIYLSVIGFMEPVRHAIITNKWNSNNTVPCYMELLNTPCTGIDGLCPLSGC